MQYNVSFVWPPDPGGLFCVIWEDQSAARLNLVERSGFYFDRSGKRRSANPAYVETLAEVVTGGTRGGSAPG